MKLAPVVTALPRARWSGVLLLLALCAGCEQEGPAERAGKELDQAAAQVGQQLEEVGKELEEKTRAAD